VWSILLFFEYEEKYEVRRKMMSKLDCIEQFLTFGYETKKIHEELLELSELVNLPLSVTFFVLITIRFEITIAHDCAEMKVVVFTNGAVYFPKNLISPYIVNENFKKIFFFSAKFL
jgi:hypothetical protein